MKIPFGLRTSDSRMVDPTEVPNGDKCGCTCPGCDSPLIAKQGDVKEWHFAHAKGADCANAVESALHRMAKQLIMELQQVYVPGRLMERKAVGPYDEVDNIFRWQEILSAKVQTEGLVNLSDCKEEQKVDTRRPDILARIGDTAIAIEVAFTHFCDEEKLEWIKMRNLTTLEIDIGLPPETTLHEMRNALEERLFTSASSSVWLYHAGDENCTRLLDEQEQQLRLQHANADTAFEVKLVQKRANKKRKDEFKAQIRDIDSENIKLTRDLTLRIAYSKIRCTMKGHGYFAGTPDHLKQLILNTAKCFGGRYNKDYETWEFNRPPDQVITLYREIITHIEHQIDELRKPKQAPTPSPSPERTRKFRDEGERETFEEHAAILEFEAGLPRNEAEQIAFVEILKRRVKQDNSAN